MSRAICTTPSAVSPPGIGALLTLPSTPGTRARHASKLPPHTVTAPVGLSTRVSVTRGQSLALGHTCAISASPSAAASRVQPRTVLKKPGTRGWYWSPPAPKMERSLEKTMSWPEKSDLIWCPYSCTEFSMRW